MDTDFLEGLENDDEHDLLVALLDRLPSTKRGLTVINAAAVPVGGMHEILAGMIDDVDRVKEASLLAKVYARNQFIEWHDNGPSGLNFRWREGSRSIIVLSLDHTVQVLRLRDEPDEVPPVEPDVLFAIDDFITNLPEPRTSG